MTSDRLRTAGMELNSAIAADMDAVQRVAFSAGVTRTVYSLEYPETRAVITEVLASADSSPLLGMYDEPWTRKQDSMHEALIQRWLAWTAAVVSIDVGTFPYSYPTNGSSEAIRDAIMNHAAKRIPGVCLHVFEGEYEGYEMIAAAVKMPVVKHSRREKIEDILGKYEDGDLWIISQPSSLDGNIWDGYDDFMKALTARNATVFVDLCYVGCVWHNNYRINVNYPCVKTVFWSLSKVFGVYYWRIGGCFSRTELPGLYGNMWFKNLMSIRIGYELLQRYACGELAAKYRPGQIVATDILNKMIAHVYSVPNKVQPSDVVILGHDTREVGMPDNALDEMMCRVKAKYRSSRYCLTSGIARFYIPSLNRGTL